MKDMDEGVLASDISIQSIPCLLSCPCITALNGHIPMNLNDPGPTAGHQSVTHSLPINDQSQEHP
jgi:hypothetical protein